MPFAYFIKEIQFKKYYSFWDKLYPREYCLALFLGLNTY